MSAVNHSPLECVPLSFFEDNKWTFFKGLICSECGRIPSPHVSYMAGKIDQHWKCRIVYKPIRCFKVKTGNLWPQMLNLTIPPKETISLKELFYVENIRRQGKITIFFPKFTFNLFSLCRSIKWLKEGVSHIASILNEKMNTNISNTRLQKAAITIPLCMLSETIGCWVYNRRKWNYSPSSALLVSISLSGRQEKAFTQNLNCLKRKGSCGVTFERLMLEYLLHFDLSKGTRCYSWYEPACATPGSKTRSSSIEFRY